MSRATSPANVPPLEELLPPGRAEAISTPLLEWFAREQRDLPWRRTTDPYAIWVSEAMLQQTQVATVIPYYQRWMERLPTLEALAAATEDDVLHAWQGLGYYSRARSLLAGARAVMAEYGGKLPSSSEALRALPGIGRYTAGAIASIAYNVPAPVVDGNVVRVLSRVFCLRGDPARAPLRGRLWELAEALIPPGHARKFNPALMELGATVCTPANPRCGTCSLESVCCARREGIERELPETAARPAVAEVRMAAALVRRGETLLLVRLPDDAPRWAGMWQFPSVELAPGETAEGGAARAVRAITGFEVKAGARFAVVRHGVTRYRITLEAFWCEPAEGGPLLLSGDGSRDWAWVPISTLEEYALPAAHRKIARRIEALERSEERQLELGLAS